MIVWEGHTPHKGKDKASTINKWWQRWNMMVVVHE